MPGTSPVYWPELHDACMEFDPPHEPYFDHDHVRETRGRQFWTAQAEIREQLNAIDPRAVIGGWRVEFFPSYPGVNLALRRPADENEAAEHHGDCLVAMSDIIGFVQDRLNIVLANPAHTRLLSFSVDQPEDWDPCMVGTAVQYLAGRQRSFIAQVSPELSLRAEGEPRQPLPHPQDPDRLTPQAVDTLFAQSVEVDDDDCDVRLTDESSNCEQEGGKSEEDEDDL